MDDKTLYIVIPDNLYDNWVKNSQEDKFNECLDKLNKEKVEIIQYSKYKELLEG